MHIAWIRFDSEGFAVGVSPAAAMRTKVHNISSEMWWFGLDEWMIGFEKMETCLHIARYMDVLTFTLGSAQFWPVIHICSQNSCRLQTCEE